MIKGKTYLVGQNIVITREPQQMGELAALLEVHGANVIAYPTIRIADPMTWSKLDQALDRLNSYHWVIFTSVNAVDRFIHRLNFLGKDIHQFGAAQLAAIGDATRRRLEYYKLKVDFCPDQFVAEALLRGFQRFGNLSAKKILLPRAKDARMVLVDGLTKLGAQVDNVTLYRTVCYSKDDKTVLRLLRHGKIHWVTFTSSSTVINFVKKLKYRKIKPKRSWKIASIGPITTETLRRVGYRVDVQAKEYTIAGLVDVMIEYGAPT